MAKENIAKFFDAAATDKVLAGKLAALAAECGYAFTAAELLELGAARPLSDEEAKGAAGGYCNYPLCNSCGHQWGSNPAEDLTCPVCKSSDIYVW